MSLSIQSASSPGSPAGIYIHVPFCKSRCGYCDFYSTTGSISARRFLKALKHEVITRARFFPGKPSIMSVYFGGGTPSVLPAKNIAEILTFLKTCFAVVPGAEITVEMNPGDVTKDSIRSLAEAGVNRVSLGIQSFCGDLLKFLGRRHSADEGRRALDLLLGSGKFQVSADFITGVRNQDYKTHLLDIKKAAAQPLKHLSVYTLSLEPQTPLYKTYKKTKNHPKTDDTRKVLMSDAACEKLFYEISGFLTEKGFKHYEISSYAKEGRISVHNSSYWIRRPYLGLGPSAHSFDGKIRYHNPADLTAWLHYYTDSNQKSNKANDFIKAKKNKKPAENMYRPPFFTTERLCEKAVHNEIVMLSLRRSEGLSLNAEGLIISQEFNSKVKFLKEQELLVQKAGNVYVNPRERYKTDGIIRELMV